MKNEKIIWFLYFKKSISRSGYVMKGKIRIFNEFQMEMLQSLFNFSFLKIVEIEPPNKVQSFFSSERDAFSAHKTSLFISFTSLIGMEWTKASLVGMDLFNMAQFSFIF
jgi:hypothetical protein